MTETETLKCNIANIISTYSASDNATIDNGWKTTSEVLVIYVMLLDMLLEVFHVQLFKDLHVSITAIAKSADF